MLRRVPRVLKVAVLATVLLAVGASIFQSWMAGTVGAAGYTQTQWGPLGPADRNLLIAVRLAGLWEGPSGEQAETQAGRVEVRQVGTNLHNEHEDLDLLTRQTAEQLGVMLPARPTATQLSWMNELAGLSGTQYDQRFVQLLREAHGTVLPVIAYVRVSTRNELVRQFAEEADAYVTRHIGYLESTGLVDYDALPEAPSPGLLSSQAGPLDLVVPGLVVVAALLATFALFSALRKKPAKKSGGSTSGARRRPRPDPAPLATGRAIAAIAVPEPRAAAADATRSSQSEPFTVPPATTESPSGRWVRPGSDTGPHVVTVMDTDVRQPVPGYGRQGFPDDGYDYDSPVTPAHGIPAVQSTLASPVHVGYGVADSGPHRLPNNGAHYR